MRLLGRLLSDIIVVEFAVQFLILSFQLGLPAKPVLNSDELLIEHSEQLDLVLTVDFLVLNDKSNVVVGW